MSLAGRERSLTIDSLRTTKDAYLVAFAEIADRDAAALLSGAELSIHRGDLPPLEPGEFYLYELRGATVLDDAGARLGVVRGISSVGGQDLLVIDTPDGEHLVNTLGETLVHFDREEHAITVRLVPGVWD